jgi:hypothetical protein
MKNTGAMHFGISGAFDSSRGDYRLCGVTAGFGGKSHMDYQKVPENADRFCEELNRRMPAKGLQEQYNLAFDAHLNIVTIHP